MLSIFMHDPAGLAGAGHPRLQGDALLADAASGCRMAVRYKKNQIASMTGLV
jgi:hypothetical protein